MKKRDTGFTLTELIVTIAIIAVLAGVAIPSIAGAMKTARLVRYDEHARTIFLAAQTRLTNMHYSGELEKVNIETETKLVTADKVANVPQNADVRYMRIDLNDTLPNTQRDAQLADLLKWQLNDTSMQNASVLLEYSAVTGRVYAVLYSEEAEGFRYADEAGAGFVNVSVRTETAKRRGMFGYYGVDTLNVGVTDAVLELDEVSLVNADRLYLTWTIKSVSGTLPNDANAEYTIKLYDKNQKECYSFSVNGSQINANSVGAPLLNLSNYDVTAQTKRVDGTAQNMQHCIYKEGARYFLVLDAMDIGGTYGIIKRYADIPAGNMYATLSVAAAGGAPSDPIVTAMEHTLFTTKDKSVDGAELKLNNKQYAIAYPRHLYNVRFMDAKTDYVQISDVDFDAAVKGRYITNNGASLSEGLLPVPSFGAATNVKYNGKYSGKYNGIVHSIIGAQIQRIDGYPAGLFGEVDKQGNVVDLILKRVSVVGVPVVSKPTGAVAGINRGTISGVQALDIKVTGLDYVGGLVGYGEIMSNITNCSTSMTQDSGALVSGKSYVGGIVGYNVAQNKSNGALIGLVNRLTVKGSGDHIGGIVGYMKPANISYNEDNVSIAGCKNMGSVSCTASGMSRVGGITGECPDGMLIRNCENYGDVNGGMYAGGIAGRNLGWVLDCMAMGGTITSSSTGACIGGITGVNSLIGTIEYKYIQRNSEGYHVLATNIRAGGSNQYAGGVTGKNDADSIFMTAFKYFDFAGTATQLANTTGVQLGGIIGRLRANEFISNCTLSGIVSGVDGYTGGLVGYNEGKVGNVTIAGRKNAPRVSGGSNVGGIAGGCGSGAAITDVKVNNTDGALKAMIVTGSGNNVGGITGSAANVTKLTLNNIETYASVSGSGTRVGAIAGSIVAGRLNSKGAVSISKCRNYGSVYGHGVSCGGIAGFISNNVGSAAPLLIEDCHNGGRIHNTDEQVGGIIGGSINAIEVSGCSNMNSGVVTGNTDRIGGIIGFATGSNQVKITNCECNGKVAGLSAGGSNQSEFVAGIIGFVEGEIGTSIAECTLRSTADISASKSVAGILGGSLFNNGMSITRCVTQTGASIVAEQNIAGGIVAYGGNKIAITDCVNSANISAAKAGAVGGIAGIVADNSSIINCKNYGSITAASGVGGIVGVISHLASNNGTDVRDCANYGTLNAMADNAGGIVGCMESKKDKISDCVNYGALKISGSGSVARFGGIVGKSYASTINGCVNLGAIVTAADSNAAIKYIGGIVGNMPMAADSLASCINIAPITIGGVSASCVGGVVGSNAGIVTGCSALITAETTLSDALKAAIAAAAQLDAQLFIKCPPQNGFAVGAAEISIAPYADCIGGIAGENKLDAQIINGVGANGVVRSELNIATGDSADKQGCIGGIAGSNAGTVLGCYYSGTISINSIGTASSVGGLVGTDAEGSNSTITNSYYIGNMAGSAQTSVYRGGILGVAVDNGGVIISGCGYNTAGVPETTVDGVAQKRIIGNYTNQMPPSTGAVEGSFTQGSAVGAIIGYVPGAAMMPPQIITPTDIPPEITTPTDIPPEITTPTDIPPEVTTPSDIPPEITTPSDIPPEVTTPSDVLLEKREIFANIAMQSIKDGIRGAVRRTA
ncbi:MAG: type II secretion system protein [Clostridia bacterium]